MEVKNDRRTEFLRAIETLSGYEKPLEQAVNEKGPGGEAYDRAPTPPPEAHRHFETNLTEEALAVNDQLGGLAEAAQSWRPMLSKLRAPLILAGGFGLAVAVGRRLARRAPERRKTKGEAMEMPGVIEAIEKDHREVEQTFEQMSQSADREQRLRLFTRVREALKAHAHGEQIAVYPVLAERDADAARHLRDDHATVDQLLGEMVLVATDDARWNPLFRQLQDAVKAHVATERETLFPALRRVCNERDLARLGNRFREAKDTRRSDRAA